MDNKEQITDLMKGLHEWRNTYNGDSIGRGIDEYAQKERLDYPEAYAKFARGYLALYRITGDAEYKEYAKKALSWLISNRSPGYRGYCWGLPFGWEGVPANGPYLIVSAFCAQAFLDMYRTENDDKYRKIVESACRWIYEENAKKEDETRFFLHYSPHKCNDYFIPNAASIALDFLSDAHNTIDTLGIEDKTPKIAEALTSAQNKDGSWYYSTKSTVIDNHHTAYTLEGLWRHYNKTGDKSILTGLVKGTDYFWNIFYDNRGYGTGRRLHGIGEITQVSPTRILKDTIIKTANLFRLLSDRNPETSLWGYAASIRALAYASEHDAKYLAYAHRILDYLKENLHDDEGFFYYQKKERCGYIRHEAHIFDTLGVLAEHGEIRP